MRWGAYGPSVRQLLDLCPRVLPPKLEVEEVHDSAVAGPIAHGGRLLGVASKRLVTEHRVAVVDRPHDVLEVHERRRVDGDEIDVGSHCALHGRFVAWADDLDFEVEALISRSRRMLTESGTDDRDFQRPVHRNQRPPAL